MALGLISELGGGAAGREGRAADGADGFAGATLAAAAREGLLTDGRGPLALPDASLPPRPTFSCDRPTAGGRTTRRGQGAAERPPPSWLGPPLLSATLLVVWFVTLLFALLFTLLLAFGLRLGATLTAALALAEADGPARLGAAFAGPALALGQALWSGQ